MPAQQHQRRVVHAHRRSAADARQHRSCGGRIRWAPSRCTGSRCRSHGPARRAGLPVGDVSAIRTVSSELVGRSPMAPQGVRQFAINGQPLVIRGGGWAEDLFLRYSASNTAEQIALIKNLGLNAIRTEGKQMPEDFYEQMDRAGILVDAGFQCCDAWQPEHARLTKRGRSGALASACAIGEQLRNHPSVIDFSWSDNAPTPSRKSVSLKGLRRSRLPGSADRLGGVQRARASSARPARRRGRTTGCRRATGMTTATTTATTRPARTSAAPGASTARPAPATRCRRSTRSNASCRSREQKQLWQEPTYNQYHTNYEPELPGPKNGGYSFGTLYELDRAIASALRAAVEPRRIRRGRAGAELRNPARAVRGLHRPRRRHADAVHGRHLLAAQQGLADAAVGPLQRGIRPGRQLLRREGGQHAAARPLRLRHGHRHARQPHRPDAAACRCGRAYTRSAGSCSTTRAPADVSSARRACSTT